MLVLFYVFPLAKLDQTTNAVNNVDSHAFGEYYHVI